VNRVTSSRGNRRKSIVSGRRDVSVVIPYYNRDKYIDEAVESVLAQTLRPLEIIIVNDCSQESSRRYLDRYAESCTIIDLPVNVGLAGARNAGIRVARGEFIAFLDDDDIWLPKKLELQREYMEEHPKCAVVHTAAWFFFVGEPDMLFKNFDTGTMTLAQSLTNEYWAIIPTCLARSEAVRAVEGFDVTFRQCEDRDFIIRCCAAGYRVEGIPEGLARVRRQKQDGLTKSHWRMFRTDLRMCWKHRAHYLGAYGVRGITNFILEKLQIVIQALRLPGCRTWRYRTIKYRVKSGYHDPILFGHCEQAFVSQFPSDAERLAGGGPL
jgi:glycosyltransferase involved in cell wall biosynthesis